MTRYLLDTDHVSLHEHGHPAVLARLAALPPDSVAVSVVTVEEAMRGRLAILARRSADEARVRAYAKFMETVRFFSLIPVVPFDLACEQRFTNCGLKGCAWGVGVCGLRPQPWCTT